MIRNGPKRTTSTNGGLRLLQMVSERTTSTNGGLRLLQMVSESNRRQCVNEDAGPQGG